jgi:hypothetical protein
MRERSGLNYCLPDNLRQSFRHALEFVLSTQELVRVLRFWLIQIRYFCRRWVARSLQRRRIRGCGLDSYGFLIPTSGTRKFDCVRYYLVQIFFVLHFFPRLSGVGVALLRFAKLLRVVSDVCCLFRGRRGADVPHGEATRWKKVCQHFPKALHPRHAHAAARASRMPAIFIS